MASQKMMQKQEIISNLRQNLNEQNIDNFMNELQRALNKVFSKEIVEKGYKWYLQSKFSLQASIIIDNGTKIVPGFGRTKFEAQLNSLINLIEVLIEDEANIIEIKSISNFLKVCSNYEGPRTQAV